MKIVINRCFGGFGLSHEAVLRYAELKGIKLNFLQGKHGMYDYSTAEVGSSEFYKNKFYFLEYDINRNDPVLVQVVMELESRANGHCAELTIIEIPDGVEWEIDEYDGMESIHEVHRSWY